MSQYLGTTPGCTGGQICSGNSNNFYVVLFYPRPDLQVLRGDDYIDTRLEARTCLGLQVPVDIHTCKKAKSQRQDPNHQQTCAVHTAPLKTKLAPQKRYCGLYAQSGYFYWMELATEENTLLALDPINRTVPTTMTRITASMTAYSAISCPLCSLHNLRR